MTRVLVCGGRNFTGRTLLWKTLDGIHRQTPIECLIHGAAEGADALAREWSHARCIPYLTFPANWNAFGKAAGPLRNQRMIDEGRPDLVVAFAGGRGTADMVGRAQKSSIQVAHFFAPAETMA